MQKIRKSENPENQNFGNDVIFRHRMSQ